jgi:leucyl/phenylalanyl-tRNA---protein transferase
MTSPSGKLSAADQARVAALLGAYRQGWFPMHDDRTGEARWVQPLNRGIIPLDDRFRVPRTLRARVRSRRFDIRSDAAFEQVIHDCAAPGPGRPQTWLSPIIIDAFLLLHRAGHAHSVEAWLPGDPPRLVGGLYGLALGGVFCGESMFSRPDLGGTDASKVCLVHLVHHLRARGFSVLDAQLTNDHLEQFGCFELPQAEYLALLARHALDQAPWGPFDPGAAPRQV